MRRLHRPLSESRYAFQQKRPGRRGLRCLPDLRILRAGMPGQSHYSLVKVHKIVHFILLKPHCNKNRFMLLSWQMEIHITVEGFERDYKPNHEA